MSSESKTRPRVENQYPQVQSRLSATWARGVTERRHQLGLSQDQLAELSGLTQAGISIIESGKGLPQVVSIIALARALGTTPGELFPWPDMADLVPEAS